MQHLPSHYWWDLTTRDFAALDMSQVVAVQPIAAVEQHGPHLPVSVDATINAGLVEATVALMPAACPALVLPMQSVGKSNEHEAFPGTLSLSYETLTRLWLDIGASVHRAGCRKIIFFNSHGGQVQVMEIVCRELRVRHGMLAVGASWNGMINMDDLFDPAERRHGIHGGAIETSAMLHLHPQLVDMSRAQDFVPLSVALEAGGGLLVPEGGVGFGWQSQDLHASGACGNAAAADAVRGEILVARAAQALLGLVDEVAAFPLAHLRERGAGAP
jgi:creatinine amidohydrolase